MRLLLAATAALLLAGCEVYAVPQPIDCPGQQQGVFDFVGWLNPNLTTCTFAQPSNPNFQVNNPVTFTGSINFGDASSAAVCIQAAHAVPRVGTYDIVNATTDHLSVAYGKVPSATSTPPYVSVSVGGCTCASVEAATAAKCSCPANTPTTGCSCPVIIEERIDGWMTVPGNNAPKSFAGAQVVTVRPPLDVPASQLCDCQQACSYTYDMTATDVGAR